MQTEIQSRAYMSWKAHQRRIRRLEMIRNAVYYVFVTASFVFAGAVTLGTIFN